MDEFVARMKGLAGSTLRSFHEKLLGTDIQVFGNVAIASAACKMTENGNAVNCNVEMMLLVKTDGAWRIAAQAWDSAKPDRPVPANLLKS